MLTNLLSKKATDILNQAVQSELYASHLYKHVANQLQRLGYFGAQKHFAEEANDELEHYKKIVEFMNDMGGVAKTPALEAVTDSINDLMSAIQLAYDTEVQLGQDYENWYETCGSPTVQQFLLFYLEEQRTSIGEYGDWITRLNRAGSNEAAILLIDQELGA